MTIAFLSPPPARRTLTPRAGPATEASFGPDTSPSLALSSAPHPPHSSPSSSRVADERARGPVPRYPGCSLYFIWVGSVDLFYEAQSKPPHHSRSRQERSKAPNPVLAGVLAAGLLVVISGVLAFTLPGLTEAGWGPAPQQIRDFSAGLATVAAGAVLIGAPLWLGRNLKKYLCRACLRGWEVHAGLRAPALGWRGPR